MGENPRWSKVFVFALDNGFGPNKIGTAHSGDLLDHTLFGANQYNGAYEDNQELYGIDNSECGVSETEQPVFRDTDSVANHSGQLGGRGEEEQILKDFPTLSHEHLRAASPLPRRRRSMTCLMRNCRRPTFDRTPHAESARACGSSRKCKSSWTEFADLAGRLVDLAGHDVKTSPQENLIGADDDVLWAAAQAAGRFLINKTWVLPISVGFRPARMPACYRFVGSSQSK